MEKFWILMLYKLYERKNVSIGFEVSNYLYKESGSVKLTGTKCGLCRECRFLSDSINIFLQSSFMAGEVGYDGASDDGKIKLKCSGIPDWYLDIRGLLGPVIRGSDTNVKWFPFFGLGSRFLKNEFSVAQFGWDRSSHY
jgi:hypothetical protein